MLIANNMAGFQKAVYERRNLFNRVIFFGVNMIEISKSYLKFSISCYRGSKYVKQPLIHRYFACACRQPRWRKKHASFARLWKFNTSLTGFRLNSAIQVNSAPLESSQINQENPFSSSLELCFRLFVHIDSNFDGQQFLENRKCLSNVTQCHKCSNWHVVI